MNLLCLERSILPRNSVACPCSIPRRFVYLSLLAMLVLPVAFSTPLFASSKNRSQKVKPATSSAQANWELGPTSVIFQFQTVGTTSHPVTLTVSNFQLNSLGLNTVTVSGDFAQTNNCAGTTPGQGGECNVYVTFSPKAAGFSTGTLTITDNTGASLSATLVGAAVAAGKGATLAGVSASGNASPYTLTGNVIGTLTTAWPTGSVSFLDASNDNLPVGTGTLGQPFSGVSIGNGPSEVTGTESSGVVTGDFNGDGKTDLVVLNNGGTPCGSIGSVSIWLGNGDETFKAAPSMPISGCPANIVAGDFNGDHKLDLAFASGSTVTVLFGNGDGTFSASTTSLATGAIFLATGDFNGDGIADLVAMPVSGTSGTVTVLLGQTNGTFVTKSVTVPLLSHPLGIAVADFNGDGKADIAALSADYTPDTTVATLLGNGDGTFQPGASTDIGQSFSAAMNADQMFAAGDFDGDGKADLVIAGATTVDAFEVLMSKGDGSFTVEPPVALGANYDSVSISVATADFDGDGKADIAVLNDNIVGIYLRKGDGTFTSHVQLDSGAETVPDWLALAVGDFNGDGQPDVATVNSDSDLVSLAIVQRIHSASATVSNVSIPGSGTHNLLASYEGDGTFGASTSDTIPLTASPVTTKLTLSSSAGLSTSGTTLVLTATLAPYSEGSLSTGGETVTLSNNGTAIGTAALSSGVATLNISSLPVGTDTVTAAYAGDANFLSSTSSAVSIVVAAPTPAATVSPATLTFDGQTVGSTSAAKPVTLTSIGTLALGISSIAASGDFAQTNNCGSTLNAGDTCTVSVTFKPTAGGTRTGSLTITDNAGGSPQTVSLTGTGSAVTMASPSTSLSISSAGGSANANIQLSSSGGYSGPVALACSVSYQGTGTVTHAPTCSFAPGQVTVSASSTATTTLTVNTTAATSALLKNELFGFGGPSLAVLFFFERRPRRRLRFLAMVALICLAAVGTTVGCGGGGSHASGGSPSPGTTTGNYTVTVTATGETDSVTLNFPLSVQ